ncbi:MAG: hypothetical protein BWY09_01730 [Candidatus Hydrogenedentes bacterium ADurb.Bin179]|nr:MAG: hypothetical protein BWY09_01730 [Candidatus Hydrogenedentes bacterium ADurb.Bin179]
MFYIFPGLFHQVAQFNRLSGEFPHGVSDIFFRFLQGKSVDACAQFLRKGTHHELLMFVAAGPGGLCQQCTPLRTVSQPDLHVNTTFKKRVCLVPINLQFLLKLGHHIPGIGTRCMGIVIRPPFFIMRLKSRGKGRHRQPVKFMVCQLS